MHRWRYDDVVRFIAPILFGTSFREFNNLWTSFENLGCSYWWGLPTAIAFFCVYFRNVHGLIAHDIWIDNTEYDPPLESSSLMALVNFILAVMSAIISPYISLTCLVDWFGAHAIDPKLGESPRALTLALLLSGSIMVYPAWDILWLWTLCRHRSKRHRLAHRKLLGIVSRWTGYDTLMLSLYLGVSYSTPAWLVHPGRELRSILIEDDPTVAVCELYVVLAALYLLLDYLSNMNYYFAIPFYKRPDLSDTTLMSYEYGEPWATILPDGMSFCHWGGRQISFELVKHLGLREGDRILELCCGEGGTLELVLDDANAKGIVDFRLCGVDVSGTAIEKAQQSLQTYVEKQKLTLIPEDAFRFLERQCANSFTKVFAQDGDAWLRPDKHTLMAEIHRVMLDGGLFIYQSYVCTRRVPSSSAARMERVLERCGYSFTEVPELAELPSLFQTAGFSVLNIKPLHRIYADDNKRMRERFNLQRQHLLSVCKKRELKAIEQLLVREREFFTNGLWSGVLVIARKSP